jgi:two-component system chemotaxis response regulator CheB
VLPGLRRALPPDSIELVGTASTPASALAQLRRGYPDVVVLDLSLSQTDVFQLIALLVQEQAAPVLALATGAEASHLAERARAAGVSDVVERGVSWHEETGSPHLLSLRIIAVAAGARPRPSNLSLRASRLSTSPKSGPAAPLLASGSSKPAGPLSASPSRKLSKPAGSPAGWSPSPPTAAQVGRSVPRLSRPLMAATKIQLIAIGASTGGTLALSELLRTLPASSPPMLVVQHMLPEFTSDFADRLNEASDLEVRVALDGELVKQGSVLLAPGGRHLRVMRDAERQLRARLSDERPVGKHKPSVDVLFEACAEVLGAAVVGVLLTGMGDDGARGLLALHNAGARTLVQDQASSACFGMPASAIALGAAQQVLPLPEIAHALRELQALAR